MKENSDRRSVIDKLKNECQTKATEDAKAAVGMICDEWPPGEVLTFVLVVPTASGKGSWWSNFQHKAKFLEVLNAVLESSKTVLFEGDKK